MKYEDLTKEYLLMLFDYNAETGEVKNKVTRSYRAKAGTTVSSKGAGGYFKVGIDGSSFLLHRLIWLMVTGKHVPKNIDVDHANRIRLDNSWKNLRLATRSQTRQNSTISSRNSTGIKGVSWDNWYKSYRADIKVEGKPIILGYFSTVEEAGYAYEKAAAEHFGKFANPEWNI